MADEKKQLRCRNCDWTGTEDQLGRQLGEIHHLIEKIEPGEIVPYGECPECGCLCFAVTDLFPEKPKVKLIVEMHGGTIQSVMKDTDAVDVTDVIFTERPGELLDEDDRNDEGELRFGIQSGDLEGEGIYAHHGPIDIASPETFDPVMTAAVDRIEWHKTKEKN
jgi:hypothetical protein